MTSVDSKRTSRQARLGVVIALTTLALVVSALPAFGHASFPGSAAFGFEPNTMGGTGALGSTPPYSANSSETIFARVPHEQGDILHNGAFDTTVDVKVIAPAGWTAPGCGTANLQKNDATTNFTNQPASAAPGWQCETYFSMGHHVIHFWGPQVTAEQLAADSAQFFSFSITTPAPTVQTPYNGLEGTEGFIVDQVYASGVTEHWIPNAAYVGSPPPGSTTTVAGGLVRSVSACGDDVPGPFVDVDGEHDFCRDIDWMAFRDISTGFDDDTFRPLNPVTRQAMASFLYKYEGSPTVTLTEPFFADVPETHPFYTAIQWMAESGLSTGTPQPVGKPLYKPAGNVSRQAMASFLWRNAGEPAVTLPEPFFADVPESNLFFDAIQWMAETELSTGTPQPSGDPLYKPASNVSRQATSAFLHRYDLLP